MSYIDDNLLSNEQVLYRTHLHRISFLTPAFWTVLILLFLILNANFRAVGYVALLIVGFFWLIALTKYWFSEFAVTNQRVILKTGFIRINAFELLLNRIEGVEVQQTILGRLFNYGTILITGTGGRIEFFPLIAQPLQFRKQVHEQINILVQSKGINL